MKIIGTGTAWESEHRHPGRLHHLLCLWCVQDRIVPGNIDTQELVIDRSNDLAGVDADRRQKRAGLEALQAGNGAPSSWSDSNVDCPQRRATFSNLHRIPPVVRRRVQRRPTRPMQAGIPGHGDLPDQQTPRLDVSPQRSMAVLQGMTPERGRAQARLRERYSSCKRNSARTRRRIPPAPKHKRKVVMVRRSIRRMHPSVTEVTHILSIRRISRRKR